MNYTPFNELKVTTITMTMSLCNSVDKNAAFHFLPITRMDIDKKKETAKCELPYCDVPGSILSIRWRHGVRGIIRNHLKPFKNAVTLDIATKKKNISLKLSQSSIQMCGASSKEDGVEAATHVLEHLNQLQKMFNYIHAHTEQALQCIEWIKYITRGEPTIKVWTDILTYSQFAFSVVHEMPDFIIKNPRNHTYPLLKSNVLSIKNVEDNENKPIKSEDVKPIKSEEVKPIESENLKPSNLKASNFVFSEVIEGGIPAHLDRKIIDFMLPFCDDFKYASDIAKKLEFIMRVKLITLGSLTIRNVSEAMVNYNFNLGYQIDRSKLNELIDGRNGFISRFNNAVSNCVTIERPYAPIEGRKVKKNKVPHHTFLVYRSSSVTYSGPKMSLMEDVYILFRETMNELREQIELKEL